MRGYKSTPIMVSVMEMHKKQKMRGKNRPQDSRANHLRQAYVGFGEWTVVGERGKKFYLITGVECDHLVGIESLRVLEWGVISTLLTEEAKKKLRGRIKKILEAVDYPLFGDGVAIFETRREAEKVIDLLAESCGF
jgi:hypothetical protein